MEEKCDIFGKEAERNCQKYCTISWRINWEKLFGRRMKALPLKGEWFKKGKRKGH